MFPFFGNKTENDLKNLIKASKTRPAFKCSACETETSAVDMAKGFYICPKCGKYQRVAPRDRIALVCDKDSFKEIGAGITSKDFLEFPGYEDKLMKSRAATGEGEAVICGEVKIDGEKCVIFVMDARFMMASMGSAVGERITRAFEYATENNLPVIGFTASGGARMQEGIVSLMQMAKTSAAVKRHSDGGNLYITVLTDPTTGGVTASFAMLGDIIIAEPKALVGFAGRRVVEQTTKTKLPDNFQSAEFLMEHGFVDSIVDREEIRASVANLIRMHKCGATKKKKGGLFA